MDRSVPIFESYLIVLKITVLFCSQIIKEEYGVYSKQINVIQYRKHALKKL